MAPSEYSTDIIADGPISATLVTAYGKGAWGWYFIYHRDIVFFFLISDSRLINVGRIRGKISISKLGPHKGEPSDCVETMIRDTCTYQMY